MIRSDLPTKNKQKRLKSQKRRVKSLKRRAKRLITKQRQLRKLKMTKRKRRKIKKKRRKSRCRSHPLTRLSPPKRRLMCLTTPNQSPKKAMRTNWQSSLPKLPQNDVQCNMTYGISSTKSMANKPYRTVIS